MYTLTEQQYGTTLHPSLFYCWNLYFPSLNRHELFCVVLWIIYIQKYWSLSSLVFFFFLPVFLQRPPEEDTLSAVCDLLPALERRDGLSGSNSLYHMNLSDLFTPLCPNSSAELPSQSSPTERTTGSRTPNSKRTIDGSSSSSSGQSAKKSRRRTADRLPLVQHNAEKKQKESNNVSPILQQHNKTTVCVCWNTHTDTATCCLPLSTLSPVPFRFLVFAVLLHILTVQSTLAVEVVERRLAQHQYNTHFKTRLGFFLGRVLIFTRHLVSLFWNCFLKGRLNVAHFSSSGNNCKKWVGLLMLV